MNTASNAPPTATDRDRVLDFRPGMNMYWEITQSTTDTNGALLETINWVGPNTGGPPIHLHQTAEESYEVLAGTLDVLTDGHWQTLQTGEKATIPPGTRHTLKNASDRPTRFINTHSPALNFEPMFREMCALIQAGRVKRLPPNDPRSMITAAMLFNKYRAEQRFTQPPQEVFNALALVRRVARLKLEH